MVTEANLTPNNFETFFNTVIYSPQQEKYKQSHRNKCRNYVAGLSWWDRYLIFIYSFGSKSLNMTLLQGIRDEDPKNIKFWTFRFFKLWKHDRSEIPSEIRNMFGTYFDNQQRYAELGPEESLKISRKLLSLIIVRLQKIILNAPKTSEDIYVFKASMGEYPGLPKQICTVPSKIACHSNYTQQRLFNSTTFDRSLDISTFIGESCCLYAIKVPQGSTLFHIPQDIHAYPHEDEALLPFGSTFIFTFKVKAKYSMISAEKTGFYQDPRDPVIGPVFRYNRDGVKTIYINTYYGRYVPPSSTCLSPQKGLITKEDASESSGNPNLTESQFEKICSKLNSIFVDKQGNILNYIYING